MTAIATSNNGQELDLDDVRHGTCSLHRYSLRLYSGITPYGHERMDVGLSLRSVWSSDQEAITNMLPSEDGTGVRVSQLRQRVQERRRFRGASELDRSVPRVPLISCSHLCLVATHGGERGSHKSAFASSSTLPIATPIDPPPYWRT